MKYQCCYLQVPVCELSIEKGELEEEFWRSQIALTSIETLSQFDNSLSDIKDNIDKAIKKSIMKLFAVSIHLTTSYSN